MVLEKTKSSEVQAHFIVKETTKNKESWQDAACHLFFPVGFCHLEGIRHKRQLFFFFVVLALFLVCDLLKPGAV